MRHAVRRLPGLALVLAIGGMLLAAPLRALAAPLEEIRAVLRAQLATPPAEAALKGLAGKDVARALAAIDPYARLIPAQEYRSPLLGPEAWTGIGASLVFVGDAVQLAVYQGGAADRMGVVDRSRLVSVDGKPVAGLAPAEIAARLRGQADTEVVLGLVEPGGANVRAHVRREAFRPLDVELVEPGDQQVLRLREFMAGLTRPALLASVDFLQKKAGRAASADAPLFIDLRDASGGDLYEAFDLAALFLPEGTALGAQQARGATPQPVRAPAGRKLTMPLVLIVGPDTASAAEVFAGILQQHGRARLVGQKTFGKCSSQTDKKLSDGSVLRFTNREILLPDGKSCSGAGLAPDVAASTRELGDLAALVRRAAPR